MRTLKGDFLEELSEVIRLREGGREIKITKQRGVVKALVAAAIKGDMKAATALVAFCSRAFSDEPKDDETKLPAEDLELLSEFVGREARRRAALSVEKPGSISLPHSEKPIDEA